jgi:acetyltransferase-like isoleucine patch superfamily enzyme
MAQRMLPAVALLADRDGDGLIDILANCPTGFNPLVENLNGDRFGDACVAPDVMIPSTARIDANPVIGNGSSIAADVVLGDNVTLGSHVILRSGVALGDGVVIADGAEIRRDATLTDAVVVGANALIGERSRIDNHW